MLLTIAIPPLRAAARGVNDMASIDAEPEIEDLAIQRRVFGAVDAVGAAGGALQAELLALLGGLEVFN